MNPFGLIVGYSLLKGSKKHKRVVKSSKKGMLLTSQIVVELTQLIALLICSIIKGIWFILNQIYRIIKDPSHPIAVVKEKKHIKNAKVIKLSDYRDKKTI